jgi:hypothetical protein
MRVLMDNPGLSENFSGLKSQRRFLACHNEDAMALCENLDDTVIQAV